MRVNEKTRGRGKERLSKMIAVCFGLIIVIAMMSACSDSTDDPANSNNKSNDLLQSDFDNKATVQLQPIGGSTETGEATITYNKETKVMSVDVQVTGLAPNSEHAQNIQSGNCAEGGAILHALDNLKANSDGKASTTNTFQDVKEFDISRMILSIHKGPDMSGANAEMVSCGPAKASK